MSDLQSVPVPRDLLVKLRTCAHELGWPGLGPFMLDTIADIVRRADALLAGVPVAEPHVQRLPCPSPGSFCYAAYAGHEHHHERRGNSDADWVVKDVPVVTDEPAETPGPEFKVGDPDTTYPITVERCERESDAVFFCTRERGHDGVHAAGDAEKIVDVWPSGAAQEGSQTVSDFDAMTVRKERERAKYDAEVEAERGWMGPDDD